MTLAETKPGQIVRIQHIQDPLIRAQAIRFGICEGTSVECFEQLRNGPIILRRRRQEIAIGRKLAEKIIVEPAVSTERKIRRAK